MGGGREGEGGREQEGRRERERRQATRAAVVTHVVVEGFRFRRVLASVPPFRGSTVEVPEDTGAGDEESGKRSTGGREAGLTTTRTAGSRVVLPK